MSFIPPSAALFAFNYSKNKNRLEMSAKLNYFYCKTQCLVDMPARIPEDKIYQHACSEGKKIVIDKKIDINLSLPPNDAVINDLFPWLIVGKLAALRKFSPPCWIFEGGGQVSAIDLQ